MVTEYFNPSRIEHLEILKFLEEDLSTEENTIIMCKFGYRTQHIFKDNKYYMTLDWSKI